MARWSAAATAAAAGLVGLASRVSHRHALLGGLLLLSALSAVSSFVLTQYYELDPFTSLTFLAADGWCEPGRGAGQHCFGDYALSADFASQANPWEERLGYRFNYTAAGLLVIRAFAVLGEWFGDPRVGLFLYLGALAVALLAPAVWAARRGPGLERIVIIVSCGLLATPVWMAIDRGNSVGLIVPLALFSLIAVARRRWWLVAVLTAAGALIKPQFAVLVVVLFVARKWRLGLLGIGMIAASNLLAFLFWPTDFPGTIAQALSNTLQYGATSSLATDYPVNVSLPRGLFQLLDGVTAIPLQGTAVDRGQGLIGYGILLAVVAAVVVLARRITPVMAAIVLLVVAALFAATSYSYYLVVALPIAAVCLRHPESAERGGLFDVGSAARRPVAGALVVVALVLSIAQVPLPFVIPTPVAEGIVLTSAAFVPVAWALALGAILLSYALRPDSRVGAGDRGREAVREIDRVGEAQEGHGDGFDGHTSGVGGDPRLPG